MYDINVHVNKFFHRNDKIFIVNNFFLKKVSQKIKLDSIVQKIKLDSLVDPLLLSSMGWLDLNLLYKDHPDWMPKHPLAPSIDKIDVDGDYTKDNIVICTRFANFGRNIFPFEEFHTVVDIVKGNVKEKNIMEII